MGVLNGKQVVERFDLDYVKGYIERLIVNQIQFIAPAYRLVKNRAPSSHDLEADGGWSWWKQRQAGLGR